MVLDLTYSKIITVNHLFPVPTSAHLVHVKTLKSPIKILTI
jgi:hypothetical protein